MGSERQRGSSSGRRALILDSSPRPHIARVAPIYGLNRASSLFILQAWFDASTRRQKKNRACRAFLHSVEPGTLRTVSAVEWPTEMDQYDANMPQVLANERLERPRERTDRRGSMAQSSSSSSRTGAVEAQNLNVWNLSSSSSCGWVVPAPKKGRGTSERRCPDVN